MYTRLTYVELVPFIMCPINVNHRLNEATNRQCQQAAWFCCKHLFRSKSAVPGIIVRGSRGTTIHDITLQTDSQKLQHSHVLCEGLILRSLVIAV